MEHALAAAEKVANSGLARTSLWSLVWALGILSQSAVLVMMNFENCVRQTATQRPLCSWLLPAFYEDADDLFEAMAADPSAPRGGGGSQDRPNNRNGPANAPLFLTSMEVAGMLRLSPKTLEKMRLEERGPRYFRLGGAGRAKVIYRLDEVEEWLAKFHR